MKKTDQLGVRWSAERKAQWEAFAEREGYKPSVLAGQVLEEFMACFLSEEELIAVGLAQMAITKPGPLLAWAFRQVPGVASRDIDKIAEQERDVYVRRSHTNKERPRTTNPRQPARPDRNSHTPEGAGRDKGGKPTGT